MGEDIIRSFTRHDMQTEQPTFSLTEFWPSELYETQVLAKCCTATMVVPIILIRSLITMCILLRCLMCFDLMGVVC